MPAPERAVAASRPEPISRRNAMYVLTALTFINLFNYVDRWVPAGLGDLLIGPLHLGDKQFAFLNTAFLIVYAVASPRFGTLGDTRARPRVIALGVALWSVATMLGGLAVGFVSLLLARSLVGVGEAAYGSIAPSLLADAYPLDRRGRVFAIFYAAIPVGSAVGYIVAGAVGSHFGWRAAFFVAGAPGLLVALAMLRLPDPPRGAEDEGVVAAAPRPAGTWRHYRALLRNAPYRWTVLGYAAYTFALGGLALWMPTFLERARGVPIKSADSQLGGILVVTGFVGTFAGGWLGDRVLRRRQNAYLLVSGIATLLAAPCALIALVVTDQRVYLASLVAAELLMFLSTGPINSAIVNYVAPTERATAMAFSILLIHALGDVPSPYIVGAISDARQAAGASGGDALQLAVLVLPIAILIGGIIWTRAAFSQEVRAGGPVPSPAG